MKTALFDRFEIDMRLADALGASHQGQCDEDVAALVDAPYIAEQLAAIGPERIRAELKSYGVWDDDALVDDEQNRHRIVWLAAGNIREEQ